MLVSGLMAAGVGVDMAVETRRRGVGVETALGSFFLWERVPLLVRCGVAVPGAARGVGATGVETEGIWVCMGKATVFCARASKSER